MTKLPHDAFSRDLFYSFQEFLQPQDQFSTFSVLRKIHDNPETAQLWAERGVSLVTSAI
jgi:hypothetical protein